MPFVGNQPAQSYSSFAKQDFTTSATTSYTLDYPVANENEIALFINFVRQEPTTAYTASGTSLTLTSATSTSDDMYAVFIGKAVQTITPLDGSITSAKISYPLTNFTSTGIDDNATSTAITIDSSEDVDIGATISSTGATSPQVTISSTGEQLLLQGTTNGIGQSVDILFEQKLTTDNTRLGGKISSVATGAYTSGSGDTYESALVFYSSDNNLNTERMRIDSSGKVGIGKTPDDIFGVAGCEFNPAGYLLFNRNGQMAYFNRPTTDGALVEFRQAGTIEGTISVSGATVTYGGFTGTHWSRFIDNSTPNILRGTVLESLDEMCDWYNLEFDVTTTTQDEDGNDITNTVTEKVPHILTDGQSVGDTITYNHEGTDVQATIVKEADIKHMKSKVSDTADAKNVYGVFSAYDEDGEGYNDFYVASVGSFVVRIKQGETVAKGDLLQSNGDGTAKVQTDDTIKASTFAKVLSTTVIETYEDGSYLVPCSLMC
jgi:hypothetical protein